MVELGGHIEVCTSGEWLPHTVGNATSTTKWGDITDVPCPSCLGVPHYFCAMNCVYSVVVLRPARAYIYREGRVSSYSILGNPLGCLNCMYSVVAVWGRA